MVLQQYSLFDGLEKEQFDKVLPFMNHETFEAGTDIIVEDGPNSKIHFIIEGHVTVMKGGITLMELKKGSVFGEMEVLEVLPVVATIKALTTTKVMTLSVDALGEIYETDLETYSFIMMNLARDLSRRLRRLNIRVIKASLPVE